MFDFDSFITYVFLKSDYLLHFAIIVIAAVVYLMFTARASAHVNEHPNCYGCAGVLIFMIAFLVPFLYLDVVTGFTYICLFIAVLWSLLVIFQLRKKGG